MKPYWNALSVVRAWVEAQIRAPEAARQSQRLLTSRYARDLPAAEPALARDAHP